MKLVFHSPSIGMHRVSVVTMAPADNRRRVELSSGGGTFLSFSLILSLSRMWNGKWLNVKIIVTMIESEYEQSETSFQWARLSLFVLRWVSAIEFVCNLHLFNLFKCTTRIVSFQFWSAKEISSLVRASSSRRAQVKRGRQCAQLARCDDSMASTHLSSSLPHFNYFSLSSISSISISNLTKSRASSVFEISFAFT